MCVEKKPNMNVQAFSSIESVVHAFSTVSMMLESSVMAIYTSFRAVVGLADQFSSLKAHFQHLFTTLALFRALRWLWRRLLVLLRLRPANFAEEIWQQASGFQLAAGVAASKSGSSTNWLLVAVWSLALGAPYLMWKLAAKVAKQADGK